jgi:hypothetical protein
LVSNNTAQLNPAAVPPQHRVVPAPFAHSLVGNARVHKWKQRDGGSISAERVRVARHLLQIPERIRPTFGAALTLIRGCQEAARRLLEIHREPSPPSSVKNQSPGRILSL